ncbi:peroxin 23 [Verticillium alfalfae VaMs.102]|uniref:Peroxin 23 n=1 Tax=Verticillium alfalfae (strain VaMs.102 / ATCC MYA-4576 / FGSC 10136) TaxID=526221 RepID=C9SWX0_VERA1|nr:peroxin 23 [Verticillium alfalfae VaMs.102]EEY23511.1 peroxin 23 [Verticillium alfalfae VaMs.102]
MATPKPARGGDDASSVADDNLQNSAPSGAPPTFASFSPVTLSASVPSRSSRRSTILVHQKSPLLLATPPQITRALAYSHSFLLPMNKAVGLLSWTTGDPWESFLLVCACGWMDDRDPEPTRNQKGHARSGSEITHTRPPEDAGRDLRDRPPTTRPALTALFVRNLFCTPFWWALTLPPWRIITTRRVVLLLGTLVLTWHARVAKVARTILWRSATVRKTVALVTGLRFEKPDRKLTPQPDSDIVTASADGPVPKIDRQTSELTKALRQRSHKHGNNATGRDAGVKFTFILYENQRRWVGLGWTQSLFAYERAAWTDEHNNSVPAKDVFELPDVEDGSKMRWRWVVGSRWRVDGVTDDAAEETDFDGEAGKNGWIYYDNKWQAGRRGEDGWGKWTRRRKWYRDAELVEISEEELAAAAAAATTAASQPTTHVYSTLSEKMVSPTQSTHNLPPFSEDGASEQAPASLSSSGGGRSFFRKPLRRRGTGQSSTR